MRFRSCAVVRRFVRGWGCRDGLQAQEPASYPHDMSDYGCTNRDENTCDQAPAPPPDYNPLVGHVGAIFAAAERLQRAASRCAAVREVHERWLLVDDGVPRQPARR